MTYKHPIYTKYGCDIDGTLYSTKGKRKSTINSTTQYRVMSIRHEGKLIQYRAHRFIYECVTQSIIPDNMVINHIDGNKINNHFDNLECITYKENTIHALQTGLMKPCVGEANGCATITADIVRNIIRDIIQGYSNKELSEKYLLDLKHISLIRNNKRWKFIFEEDEFKNYMPVKIVQRKLTNEQRIQLQKDLLTTTSNAELSRKYNIDASIISRMRSKIKQKSSTTIPNGSTPEANAGGSGVHANA